VRGILDGHIVLDRQIAERGRYPAINTLRSISRTMPGCNSQAQTDLVTRARQLLSTYEDMGELIRIGAYKQGSDAKVDEAIKYVPSIEGFLAQDKHERADLEGGYAQLARVLGIEWAQPGAGPEAPAAAPQAAGEEASTGGDPAPAAPPAGDRGKEIPRKNDLRRARRQRKASAGAAGAAGGPGEGA
jgi:flagellum-specific ATP synthase